MNPHATNWVPGWAVLSVGVVAAIFAVLALRKRYLPAPTNVLDDLEQHYRSLIAQLKSHAEMRHAMSAEAWQLEQTRLENEAAQTLREKDRAKHEGLKAQARAEKRAQAEPQGSTFKGAVMGGAVVAFFGVLGWVLIQQVTPRVDSPMTKARAPEPSQADDGQLTELLERVRRSPGDIDLLNQAVALLFRKELYEEAVPLVRQATAIDPYNVQTRIMRTVLDVVMQKTPPFAGLNELSHVAETFPDAWEARLYAGSLALDMGNREKALEQFERYLEEAPPDQQPPMLRATVEQMRAQPK